MIFAATFLFGSAYFYSEIGRHPVPDHPFKSWIGNENITRDDYTEYRGCNEYHTEHIVAGEGTLFVCFHVRFLVHLVQSRILYCTSVTLYNEYHPKQKSTIEKTRPHETRGSDLVGILSSNYSTKVFRCCPPLAHAYIVSISIDHIPFHTFFQ